MGKLKMILASDMNGSIGYNNKLLYHLSKDLKRFKELTKGSTVVMGRNTWESLPNKLPNRKNMVLTNSSYLKDNINIGLDKPDGFFSSIEGIIHYAEHSESDVWIIGGSRLYDAMIPHVVEVHHTIVKDICTKYDTFIFNLTEKLENTFEVYDYIDTTDIDKITGKEMKIRFKSYKL